MQEIWKDIPNYENYQASSFGRIKCIRQVEKELGIWGQNISKCCKGKYKSCGGFIWKYKV